MLNPNILACPPEFKAGIEQFNNQQFFQCHETLEAFWQNQKTEDRQFTQGIIQIAVGYYHLYRDNQPGAIKLFKSGMAYIDSYKPIYFNIIVEQLITQIRLDLDLLNQGLPTEKCPHIFFANHTN